MVLKEDYLLDFGNNLNIFRYTKYYFMFVLTVLLEKSVRIKDMENAGRSIYLD